MVSPVDKEYYRRLNIKPLIDYDRKPGLETLSTVLKESITSTKQGNLCARGESGGRHQMCICHQ